MNNYGIVFASKIMWNSNQRDDVQNDCVYSLLPSLNPLLDEFLDEWHDELYRKKNILRLNDDCFYIIFSYLPTIDLCAVRETCHDFRRLSDNCFEKRSKSFRLERWSVYGSLDNSLSLNDAKRVIRNFGQLITKLSIPQSQFDDPTRLLPLLDRYCCRLQNFALEIIKFLDPHTIIRYERLLSNLQQLEIRNDNNEKLIPIDINPFLAQCSSLKQLELVGFELFRSVDGSAAKRFETLEYFSLRDCIIEDTDMVTDFFIKNFQLKTVKLFSCSKIHGKAMENWNTTFPTMPNLESLCIRYLCPSLQLYMSDIYHTCATLKKLEIDLKGSRMLNVCSLLSHLAMYKNIEDLHIVSFHSFNDVLISRLCALKTLKFLKFTYVNVMTAEFNKQLACGLPNLSEIYFEKCKITHKAIEDFVEYSNSVKRIVFDCEYTLHPHLAFTKTIMLSLISARLRNKHNNESLILSLNRNVIANTNFQKDGIPDSLVEHADVIKVMPVASEYTSTQRNWLVKHHSRMGVLLPYSYLDSDSD